MNKLELEKNNFIKNLSQEQFDLVMTNKYKQVLMTYFNGKITDAELSDKINSNLDLVNIYENGDDGKIDTNQYLYAALVDVALYYYNIVTGFKESMQELHNLCLAKSIDSDIQEIVDELHEKICGD